MRISAAVAGAVTLGSQLVWAQNTAVVTSNPDVDQDLVNIVGRDVAYDACYKIDTLLNGRKSACASALSIRTYCAKQTNERDCLCNEPSSFLADQAACSECQHQNALEALSRRNYWVTFNAKIASGYCRNKTETRRFKEFREDLTKQMGPLPADEGRKNIHIGYVANDTLYYDAACYKVPAVQGPGKFVADAADAPAVVADEPVDEVTVPVFVAIEVPAEGKPANSSSGGAARPPFQNGTAIISGKPSTLTTLTSTTTTSVLSATPIAPTPAPPAVGTGSGETVIINGKVCKVYVVFVVIECSASGSGAAGIKFVNKGIDPKQPVHAVKGEEAFKKIVGAIPDAGRDSKLASEVCQVAGIEGKPVVVAPVQPVGGSGSGGEQQKPQQRLPAPPPPMKEEGVKVPSSGGNGGNGKPSADEPVEDCAEETVGDAELEDCDEETAGSAPGQPGASAPQQPSGSAPQQPSGSAPQQPSGSAPKQPAGSAPQQPAAGENAKPVTPATPQSPSGNNGNNGAPATPQTPSGSGSKPAAPGSDNSSNPSGVAGPAQIGNNASSAPGENCPVCPSTPCPTCPPSTLCPSAPVRADATAVCKKMEDKKSECLSKGDAATIQACLCSGPGFETNRFFDDSVICVRRRDESPAQGEFEAQLLLEVKFRYCDKKSVATYADAYAEVNNQWREWRQPRKELM